MGCSKAEDYRMVGNFRGSPKIRVSEIFAVLIKFRGR